jgi:uncharacterized protein
MAETSVCGKFVWHELLTTDPKAAAAFYGKIVGWKSQAWDKDPSYTLLTMGGRPMAGTMALPEAAKAMGAPPHWVSHISTPNVDATALLAHQAGGKVLRPAADIPGYGRFAVLQDPQGAVFAAFTPLPSQAAPAAGAKPGLGDFFWHELGTTNWEAAFSFYQKLFGWEKTDAMDMGAMGTYQMFGGKGQTFGGMYNKPLAVPGPAFWVPYAIVPDAKRVAKTIAQLGAKVINGPMEVPGGDWIVVGTDLQGAVFAVHSRKPAAAQITKATKATKGTTKVTKVTKATKKKSKAATKAKPAAKAKSSSAKKTAKKTAKKKTAPKRTTKKKGRKGGKKR